MILKFIFIQPIVAWAVGASKITLAPRSCRNPDFHSLNFRDLVSRQSSCPTGFTGCGSSCMPLGASCCDDTGDYCDLGLSCDNGGCCKTDEVCSGIIAGCSGTDVVCVNKCMPSDGVCCPDGTYCQQGQTCNGSTCINDTSGSSGSVCPTGQSYCTDQCIPSDYTCCGTLGNFCYPDQRCDNFGGCQPLDSVDCGDGSYCPSDAVCSTVGAGLVECFSEGAVIASATVAKASATPTTTVPAPNITTVPNPTPISTSISTPNPSPSSQRTTTSRRPVTRSSTTSGPVATSIVNPNGQGSKANTDGPAIFWELSMVAGVIAIFV